MVHPLKKQGGERLENFGSGIVIWTSTGANLRKTRAFLWGVGGGIYWVVQKEKVCGHVTMVATFLGEFAHSRSQSHSA